MCICSCFKIIYLSFHFNLKGGEKNHLKKLKLFCDNGVKKDIIYIYDTTLCVILCLARGGHGLLILQ